eukprot:5020135-Pleurochrysis_carterae.AAC.2
MRTSVGWFSSPSCALICQCSKYVAPHSSKGYAIGAKFRPWLDAELHGKEEKSFDNKLLGSVENMLAICGSRDYVFFIGAAATERFSQTGSLRTYVEEEADLGAGKAARRDPHRLWLRGHYGGGARDGLCLRVLALDAAARDWLRRAHP